MPKNTVVDNEIRFKLDAFTPKTLPMARLAQYLEKFAALLGNESNVHFIGVDDGSAVCRAYVDDTAIPKIVDRANRIKDGTASRAALKAREEINDLLAEDNSSGDFHLGSRKLIEFPGKLQKAKEEIGPIQRSTTIDGQIFSIGGKDETINVQLRGATGDIRCTVSIPLARRLASHLFGGNVRLSGRGNWYRIDGTWTMKTFCADDFIVLDDIGFVETLSRTRGLLSFMSPEELTSALQELRGE